jgi:hypothetical protein
VFTFEEDVVKETFVASPDLFLPAKFSSLRDRFSFFFYNIQSKIYDGCIAHGCADPETIGSGF